MEIFRILKLKAIKLIAATRATVVGANPISDKDILSNTKAAAIGNRLSNRDTSHPEIGRPTNELSGMVSKMVPSTASLYPKFDLMVGILDAQLEKQIPY